MYYQINGFLKHAEVDNWENGCTGECHSYQVDHKITATTLTELIQRCKDFTGGELCPDLIEPDRLDFQVMEGGEGYVISEHEIELWKSGKFDAYLCNYSAIVTKVENVDLTDEFNAYLKVN